MKSEYIQLLHKEIQKLESKVGALKYNQNVSFSFFRESFKQTQEIMRLLHELEFVQIEDMKSQMEKLMLFLSESETFTPKKSEELDITKDSKCGTVSESILYSKEGVLPVPSTSLSQDIPNEEIKDIQSEKDTPDTHESLQKRRFVKEDSPVDLIIDAHSTTNKSLNDILPTNQTILDTKQSISLNDRFLFQRELFDNDRIAMNNMMIRMQAFKTYNEQELYLKENTDWNFNDEVVEKFLEMLKKNS